MDAVLGRGYVRCIGNRLPSGYFAIAEAGNGHLYAVPSRSGRVLQIDPSSCLVQELGEAFTEPSAPGALYAVLAVGSNGHLYAPPSRAKRVLEIDPYAGVVKQIGPDFGEAPNGVHYCCIAAAGDGCMYAAPSAPGRTLKIDTVTGEVSTIGERIAEADKLQYTCIALAQNGCMYAAPCNASRVLEIEVATGAVRRIGEPIQDSASPGFAPVCLTLARNGKLYVLHPTSSRVLEIDPSSGTSRQIGPDLGPGSLWTALQEGPDGRLWGLSSRSLSTAVMIEVDPQNSAVAVHKVIDLLENGAIQENPSYMCWAMAGNGRLYAAPRTQGRILEFDPQLLISRYIGTPMAGASIYGIAVASNSRIFVAPFGQNGNIVQVDFDALPRQSGKMLCILRAALVAGDLSDAVIKTAPGKMYRTHKLILALRSRVFRSMFAANMREANDAVVELGDVAANVSDMFMKYLYAENAEADRMTLQELCELTALAHRYEIEDLCSACCGLLKVNISVPSAAQLLRFADKFQLPDLKDACFDFIVANQDVVDTNEWEEVPPALMREAAAALTGRRCKRRRITDLEFPSTTDWTTLAVPKLRRACAERGLAQEGDAASLIERLQAFQPSKRDIHEDVEV